MEATLRAWAQAYRDGPVEHRFPSDPNAEFFPVDMDDAANEIVRLRAIAMVAIDIALGAELNREMAERVGILKRELLGHQQCGSDRS